MVDGWVTGDDISAWEQRFRAALINSITGFKPVNLIGTKDPSSGHNLAVMSSVVHLGASPPLVGLVIRPDSVDRHTLRNIRTHGCYTINHVTSGFYPQAHQTAARYEDEVSEFTAVGLTPQYVEGFDAPFVGESPIKLGMTLVEEVPIKHNGTHFVIGRIDHLYIEAGLVSVYGDLDLARAEVVALSGLDRYFSANFLGKLPYAKP
jgi:flavin reductase (DIM6/NTAB) family NADH-FMN oxidoreductase RutF